MSKRLFTLLGLLVGWTSWAPSAMAVPVLNENAATMGLITMFPDHADANLYYIAPNSMSVCLDSRGVPRFSYQDVETLFSTYGMVQMTLCAYYNQDDMEAAQAALKARNPNARFAALPFVESQIVFNPVLEPFVEKEFCNHVAGMVGDELTCSFTLNNLGRNVFLGQVRGRVAMTMQFEYSIEGFQRLPDGTFAQRRVNYGVAARIGGEELRGHRELFRNSRGRPLFGY